MTRRRENTIFPADFVASAHGRAHFRRWRVYFDTGAWHRALPSGAVEAFDVRGEHGDWPSCPRLPSFTTCKIENLDEHWDKELALWEATGRALWEAACRTRCESDQADAQTRAEFEATVAEAEPVASEPVAAEPAASAQDEPITDAEDAADSEHESEHDVTRDDDEDDFIAHDDDHALSDFECESNGDDDDEDYGSDADEGRDEVGSPPSATEECMDSGSDDDMDAVQSSADAEMLAAADVEAALDAATNEQLVGRYWTLRETVVLMDAELCHMARMMADPIWRNMLKSKRDFEFGRWCKV